MKNTKAAWIIAGIVALFLLFVMPWGGGRWGGACGMMGNYYGSGSYGWGMMGSWGFGWLFMLLVIAALVLLIVWLVQQVQNPQARRK